MTSTKERGDFSALCSQITRLYTSCFYYPRNAAIRKRSTRKRKVLLYGRSEGRSQGIRWLAQTRLPWGAGCTATLSLHLFRDKKEAMKLVYIKVTT